MDTKTLEAMVSQIEVLKDDNERLKSMINNHPEIAKLKVELETAKEFVAMGDRVERRLRVSNFELRQENTKLKELLNKGLDKNFSPETIVEIRKFWQGDGWKPKGGLDG
ncbi:hypothetical protein LCGC14_1756540 [marine sediment metagenome]|uniref:Uncharacterized protein n=1 Tax=marine sediment metagenome TaxID=412755 RepID=A0A0F9JHF1_9ZZZZ